LAARRRPTAAALVAELRAKGKSSIRAGMARYAIPSDKAFGWSIGDLRALAKRTGRDHALAAALWKSGWFEARILACFVDDPAQVDARQMDRWCRDFDSWAICDTACFALLARAEGAWSRVRPWARRKAEFEKRAAFALLASLSLHDRTAPDARFARALLEVERAASDERNFVHKGVSWALRSVGKRNRQLHADALALAARLAKSPQRAAAWVGRDALRDLRSPATARRMAKKKRA
jgi:3-methyladenine DNA glycosylase AlkD